MSDPIKKAISFVQAVTSGKVDEATFQSRRLKCLGPEPCPKVRQRPHGNYCGACGCGERAISELDVKLRFKKVTCPLGRF
jgi:hypothetical protein